MIFAIFETIPDKSIIRGISLLLTKSVAERLKDVTSFIDGLGQRIYRTSRNDTADQTPPAKIDFFLAPSLRRGDALRLLSCLKKNTILIVVGAASLRDENLDAHDKVSNGREGFTLPEDYWAPSLYEFTKQVSDAVASAGAYAVVDAGQLFPYRRELAERFLSIPNIGVVARGIAHDQALVFTKANEWRRLVDDGKLGEALRSVDELPSEFADEKAFLKTRIFHRAGLHGQVLLELKQLSPNSATNPLALVLLAQAAVDAGALQFAEPLLERAIKELDSIEGLELALEIAASLDNSGAQQRAIARLESLMPDARAAKRAKLRLATAAGDFGAAFHLLTPEAQADEVGRVYAFLAKHIGPEVQVPNYAHVKQHLDSIPTWQGLSKFVCTKDALRRNLVWHAYSLVLDGSSVENLARRDVHLVLDVLEKLLSLPNAVDEHAMETDVRHTVATVIGYLALHPADTPTRLRLGHLLSTGVAGRLGIAILAHIVMKEFERPVTARPYSPVTGMSTEELFQQESFLRNGFGWLEAIAPVVLTKLKLPSKLVPENPDRFFPAVLSCLQTMAADVGSEENVNTLLQFLALGVSLSSHMGVDNAGLKMMSLVSRAVALAGKGQLARDLYEQILQSNPVGPAGRRLAWQSMAEVSCRLRNPEMALIGLACSVMNRGQIELEIAREQTNTFGRTLRDLGLFEIARKAVAAEKSLLVKMEAYEQNAHQIEFLHLQIDMKELSIDSTNAETKLPPLIDAAAANLRSARARNDAVAPTYVLLAQLVQMARKHRVAVPPEVVGILESLESAVEPSVAEPAKVVAKDRVTVVDLLQLHHRYETSRFSDDAGHDPHGVTMAARRFITIDNGNALNSELAFALDLLADRAMALPGWEIASQPVPRTSTEFETELFVTHVSKEDVSIVMGALDNDGKLVTVVASNGALRGITREDVNTFSSEYFREWRKEFPFKYGIDDNKTPNLFYDTAERLGLSSLPEGRVILVFDTDLKSIPPNLLWVDGTFSGKSRAMAATPSVAWLAHARSRRLETTKGIKAWIPAGPAATGTLAVLGDYLTDTILQHDIALDTEESLPKDFSRSQLAIIVAHGSLIPKQNFFQRVSDEGRLVVLTDDFANAFRNVGVMVLFVCSGGRTDPHPDAETTVGLARTLLDRGCAVVIASPWPLDSTVTIAWLPKFLAAWQCGKPVIDACFEANNAVAERRGDNPADCLALTVYGDPLRTIND
ncbi:CHAT domain-containing protein [Burkholderia sp. S-53]|uniref:CHAT domain-containing protein n=1 Tax=Burkholderia sp. S-53 TaxID=2906514 RepID=UPI0021D10DCF|nr:CHAT domain-containing protein [Burkholderia sp. S-53]UXU90019.1 CHAT domain-containing protein [Burkholderia sp. S-53]